MKRCVIFTSYIEGNLSSFLQITPNDYVICADGGYQYAERLGITPDLLLGDFDSLEGSLPDHIEVRTFPQEKDDTDTGLCVKTAIEMGYRDIFIAGGLGGRFDHSMANIQTIAAAAEQTDSIVLADERNLVTVLINREVVIPRQKRQYLSLFSFSESCRGVSISGVRYPLSDATMTNTFPIGVSNEFTADQAVISVKEGILLLILSSDPR